MNLKDLRGTFVIDVDRIGEGIERAVRKKLADFGVASDKAVNEIATGCAEGFGGSAVAWGLGSAFAWRLLTYNPYTATGSCVVGVGRRMK